MVSFYSFFVGGFVAYSFTAFFEPLVYTFGWSYTQVSFAASIRGLESGLLAPLVGFLLERWGPRKLIFGGAIIMVIGWLFLSSINNLISFYFAYVLIAVGTSTCMGVIPISTIAKWFRKRQSLATGIIVSGNGLGGVMVLMSTQLIDVFGWSMSAAIIGWGLLIITLPLSLLFRQSPERYNLTPDGADAYLPDMIEDPFTGQRVEAEIKVTQALKTRAFWFIAIGCMCHIMCMNAILAHIMPYLSTVNISRNVSSLVASFIPIISILGRVSFGMLGDRFDRKLVTAIGLLLTALGVTCLNYVGSGSLWILPIFLLLIGVGYGGPVTLVPALLTQRFGRSKLAPLLGLTLGLSYMGGMIGPPLAGLAFDHLDNYHVAWYGLAAVVVVGMLLILAIPMMHEQRSQSGIVVHT